MQVKVSLVIPHQADCHITNACSLPCKARGYVILGGERREALLMQLEGANGGGALNLSVEVGHQRSRGAGALGCNGTLNGDDGLGRWLCGSGGGWASTRYVCNPA